MEAVFEALTELLLAVVAFLVAWIAKEVREWIAENKSNKALTNIREGIEANKAIVSIAVQSVEQMFTESNGPVKFEKAKDAAIKMLNEVGLTVNEAEVDNLIEQSVAELKKTNAYFYE